MLRMVIAEEICFLLISSLKIMGYSGMHLFKSHKGRADMKIFTVLHHFEITL